MKTIFNFQFSLRPHSGRAIFNQFNNLTIKQLLRKSLITFLIVIIQLTGFPAVSFAQEPILSAQSETSTQSGTPNPDPISLDEQEIISEENPDDQNTTEFDEENLPPPTLNQNEIYKNSASLSRPVSVRINKKGLRADEKVTITVANTSADKIEVKLFNSDGGEVEFISEEVSDTDPAVLRIYPKNKFHPGRYRVVVTDASGTSYTQDFTWGVLAINTNKSIYKSQETAKIAFAVLNETGSMVCDASLNLEISNPDGTKANLSSEEGSIKVNPQCELKEYTTIPDFEAEYRLGGVGVYNLSFSVTTQNGEYSINDSFEVRDYVPFDVERIGPTRIYPPEKYPVTFNVIANEDFEGTVTEFVPEQIEVSQQEGTTSFNKITKFLAAPESQIKDALIANVGLPFNSRYSLSQDFGGVERDPLLKEKYAEYGVVGHDGLDFDLPSGTPVIAVDEGEVVRATENGDYGTTIVIQHTWGKSYYGHLSKIDKNQGDKVKKGEHIGYSGSSGLSTGPHLHFGIKPNINDYNNGFYGKVNPLEYLKGYSNLFKNPIEIIEDEELPGVDKEVRQSDKTVTLKAISWNIKVKKGEVIKLGYTFKAPDISPEFYLFGSLEFEDSKEKIIFQEARQWQIAADAIANNGLWAYGDSVDNGNMNFRAFTDPSTAGSELTTQATDTTNDIGWIRTNSAPTREETIAVHLKNTGRLDVVTCTTGCNAQTDWTLRGTYSTAVTDAGSETWRPFDVAYEQLSGDAIVFFTDDNTTGTIYYCMWNGSSWSPATECASTFAPGTGNDIDLTAVGVTGQPEWIRAEARGKRLTSTRSDEILLAVSDSNDDLWLAKWDGSAVTQASNPVDNLAATDAQKFDIAWEETTGEGMAVMTDTVDAALRFSNYTSGSGWSAADTTNGPTNPTTTAWNSWLELANDPTSDDIAMIGLLTTPDADAAVWTGSAWTNSTTALTDQETAAGKAAAVTFTRFSGRATFLNVGLNDLDYDGHCWTSAGGFTTLNTGVGTIALTDDGNEIVTVGSQNSNKMLGSSVDIVDDLEGFIYTDTTDCADGDWINSSVATAFNAAVRGAAGNLIRIAHYPSFTPYSPWSLNWRFYSDVTSNDPSTGWGGAAENTAATNVGLDDPIRLRINMAERGGMGQTDTRKKLQYTSGCDPNTSETACTWADVGDTSETSAVWRYATAGETCAGCADGSTSNTPRLTGTTVGDPEVFYVSDKDAAADTDFDHSALIVKEIDFPLIAEAVSLGTTYYFRLYEPRIAGTNGQDSTVFREQDNDGNNDCATSTCTYPSLTTTAPSGPTLDQLMRHGAWFSSGVEQPFTF